MYDREIGLTVNIGGRFGAKVFHPTVKIGPSPDSDEGKAILAAFDRHADALLDVLATISEEISEDLHTLLERAAEAIGSEQLAEDCQRWDHAVEREGAFLRVGQAQVRGEALQPRPARKRRPTYQA